MEISTDQTIFWQWGFVKVNATLVYTWIVMAILVLVSWLATRNLSTGRQISRWQNLLEAAVVFIQEQVRDIIHFNPGRHVPFIGSLLLFISLSNFLSFVPGYHPPTGSLSTTAGLAAVVFLAVPYYGITHAGIKEYLRHYVEPTVFVLPFQIITEFSRTIAMAIRLFGNVMSGTMIGAILLMVIPLFFPVLLQALELLIGQVQAYIFAVLASVYIGSGVRRQHKQSRETGKTTDEGEVNESKRKERQ